MGEGAVCLYQHLMPARRCANDSHCGTVLGREIVLGGSFAPNLSVREQVAIGLGKTVVYSCAGERVAVRRTQDVRDDFQPKPWSSLQGQEQFA